MTFASNIIFGFDNSYARLPEHFYARLNPTPVATPGLIKINQALARQLGLDPAALASPEGIEILAGNRIALGSEPIAMAYAGHQFANFVPQLGDGRAILLGEVIDIHGQRRDIQLKGAGPTRFSRRGDGRAALGPVLREYIVSEAMHALGIPTTRALAAVTTGETVLREQPLPGAVIARVAASHIRVGTFQFFARREDKAAVKALADHVIDRHYPDARNAENPYRALLDNIIARQASLIARWLLVGFIHGVMNTDNMTVSGETIDYGPCAFMDDYHPGMVYSSIDRHGRYAYAAQPPIAHWNLVRMAESLLTVLADEREAAVGQAHEALEAFGPAFERAFADGMRAKLGLTQSRADDMALAQELFTIMDAGSADFTLTFRGLCDAAADPAKDAAVAVLFNDPAAFNAWASRWHERLESEGAGATARRDVMRGVNPAIIPRNHLVAEAIDAAVARGDFSLFANLAAVTQRPFDDHPSPYIDPPRPEQVVAETFCGT